MSDVDTSAGGRRRNKRWPEALKREIVAASVKPGASVSVVARTYDVNANQVFMWRRRYGSAVEQPVSDTATAAPALVPVTITPSTVAEAAEPVGASITDTIEIEVGGDCRVRVGANFDAKALKRVLDVLRRR